MCPETAVECEINDWCEGEIPDHHKPPVYKVVLVGQRREPDTIMFLCPACADLIKLYARDNPGREIQVTLLDSARETARGATRAREAVSSPTNPLPNSELSNS